MAAAAMPAATGIKRGPVPLGRHPVESDQVAVPAFPRVRLLGPLSEPDVQLPPPRAIHESGWLRSHGWTWNRDSLTASREEGPRARYLVSEVSAMPRSVY